MCHITSGNVKESIRKLAPLPSNSLKNIQFSWDKKRSQHTGEI